MEDDLINEVRSIIRSIEQFHRTAAMDMLVGLDTSLEAIQDYTVLYRGKRDLAAALRRYEESAAT